jgi:hypothetical protein
VLLKGREKNLPVLKFYFVKNMGFGFALLRLKRGF